MKEKEMNDFEETPWPPPNLCPVCEGFGRVYREDDGTSAFEDDEGTPCPECAGDGTAKED